MAQGGATPKGLDCGTTTIVGGRNKIEESQKAENNYVTETSKTQKNIIFCFIGILLTCLGGVIKKNETEQRNFSNKLNQIL